MPKRSNLHQAVIFYVKKHLAPEGATVEESRMLLDNDTGELREVDVVVDAHVGDDPILVSVEVVARSRKADATWVEQMIGKHSRMPTNRLVLVSWSGFTRGALAKVSVQGGNVVALTPELVENASVPPLSYLEASPTPERLAAFLREDDGSLERVLGLPPDTTLYDRPAPDAEVCALKDWIFGVLNNGAAGKQLMDQAQAHEDRDSVTHFSLEVAEQDHLGLYVHQIEANRFRLVSGWVVVGPVKVTQAPVQFQVMRLGETVFAFTTVSMVGKDAVWVLTPNNDGTATVSWRII